MVSSLKPNPLYTFLSLGQRSIRQYALEREGRLSIDCESFRDRQGETMFRLFLHGCPDSPFYLTSAHVSTYWTERIEKQGSANQTSFDRDAQDPFDILENHLLEILSGTGYGSILLTFEKLKKQRTAFICSVTFSYRHTVSIQTK